jgi:hypothetical protein
VSTRSEMRTWGTEAAILSYSGGGGSAKATRSSCVHERQRASELALASRKAQA